MGMHYVPRARASAAWVKLLNPIRNPMVSRLSGQAKAGELILILFELKSCFIQFAYTNLLRTFKIRPGLWIPGPVSQAVRINAFRSAQNRARAHPGRPGAGGRLPARDR